MESATTFPLEELFQRYPGVGDIILNKLDVPSLASLGATSHSLRNATLNILPTTAVLQLEIQTKRKLRQSLGTLDRLPKPLQRLAILMNTPVDIRTANPIFERVRNDLVYLELNTKRGIGLGPSYLLQCLQQFPNLKKLVVSQPGFGNDDIGKPYMARVESLEEFYWDTAEPLGEPSLFFVPLFDIMGFLAFITGCVNLKRIMISKNLARYFNDDNRDCINMVLKTKYKFPQMEEVEEESSDAHYVFRFVTEK